MAVVLPTTEAPQGVPLQGFHLGCSLTQDELYLLESGEVPCLDATWGHVLPPRMSCLCLSDIQALAGLLTAGTDQAEPCMLCMPARENIRGQLCPAQAAAMGGSSLICRSIWRLDRAAQPYASRQAGYSKI